MENANKQICRLCFELILDGDCEVIEESEKEILDTLLIKIDFDISDNAVACIKCLAKLQDCYEFKSNCLYLNDYVTPFVDADVKVDIKNVFEKMTVTSDNVNLDNSQICHLCMSFIEDEAFNCYTSDLKDMIGNCLPEVNLNSVDEPLVCKPCLSNMIRYYEFMKSCKEVEQKIKNYVQRGEDHGIANKVILGDVLGLKNCGTLSKPLEKQCLNVENETECLKNEEAANIKCEEIDIKDELDIRVEMSDTVKLGNDDSSENNGSLKKMKVGKSNIEGKTFSCPKCPYSANKHATFKKHMRTHLNNKVYTCTLCSFVTDAWLSLKAHLTKVHRGATKAFGCHECPYETRFKSNLENHLLKHKDKSEVEMRKCLLCPYESKYKSALWKHQALEHSKNIKMYKCAKCSFSTKHKESLVTHLLLHRNPEEIPKHKCEECDFETRYKRILVKHMLTHQVVSTKMSKCDQSDYGTSEKSLKGKGKIKKSESKEKQHFCPKCPYSSHYSSNIKKHLRSHSDVRRCTLCSFTGPRLLLVAHIAESHSGLTKAYGCRECPYEADQKCYLERHILTHKSEWEVEMYNCALCQFKSKYKSAVWKHHKMKHVKNVEIYKCEECSFSTKYKTNLRVHQLAHKNRDEIPKFKCVKCGSEFKTRGAIKKHMVGHSGKRIFRCDKCSYSSTYKGDLPMHKCEHQKDGEGNTYEGEAEAMKYFPHEITAEYLEMQHTSETANYPKLPIFDSDHCKYPTPDQITHVGVKEAMLYYCATCNFETKHKCNLRDHVKKCLKITRDKDRKIV